MEHHLEQEIAQFIAKLAHVAALDCVGHFIGFFDRIRRDGREVLFKVPRAARLGVAQARHDSC